MELDWRWMFYLNVPIGWLLVVSLVVRGIDLGSIMAPNMAAVYSTLAPHETPRAAAALNVLNRIGGSLGTALLAVVPQAGLAGSANPAGAYGTVFWWTLGFSALAILPVALYPALKPSK